MRQALYIVVVAALLTGGVVDIVTAGVKTVVTKNHFYWAAPASGIGIAVPSGMKSFPVELPQ
jgi:hypothetical protein